jgi:hypothetical protein
MWWRSLPVVRSALENRCFIIRKRDHGAKDIVELSATGDLGTTVGAWRRCWLGS